MRRLTTIVALLAGCASTPQTRAPEAASAASVVEAPAREWTGPVMQLPDPLHFDVRGGVKIVRDNTVLVGASCGFDLAVALDEDRFSIEQGPVSVSTRYPRANQMEPVFEALARMRCVIANIESFGGFYTVDAQDVATKLAAIKQPIVELFDKLNMPAAGQALTGELAETQIENMSLVFWMAFTLAEGIKLEFLQTRQLEEENDDDGLGIPLVTWIDEVDCPFSPGRCVVLEMAVESDDPARAYEVERDTLSAGGVGMDISEDSGRLVVVASRATGIPQQIVIRERSRLSVEMGAVDREGSYVRDVTVVFDLIPRN